MGYTTATSPHKTLSLRWNGTQWARQLTPNPVASSDGAIPDFQLTDVACAAVSSCEALGSYYAEGLNYPFVESWNGSRWSLHEFGPPQLFDEALDSISCASASFCAAVGHGESQLRRTLVAMPR